MIAATLMATHARAGTPTYANCTLTSTASLDVDVADSNSGRDKCDELTQGVNTDPGECTVQVITDSNGQLKIQAQLRRKRFVTVQSNNVRGGLNALTTDLVNNGLVGAFKNALQIVLTTAGTCQ